LDVLSVHAGAREAEHQQWKAAVLRGEIELEEIDTQPYNPPSRAKPTQSPTQAAEGN
jgi:hypothetical protein